MTTDKEIPVEILVMERDAQRLLEFAEQLERFAGDLRARERAVLAEAGLRRKRAGLPDRE